MSPTLDHFQIYLKKYSYKILQFRYAICNIIKYIPHLPKRVGTSMPNEIIRQSIIMEVIHIGRYTILYKLE